MHWYLHFVYPFNQGFYSDLAAVRFITFDEQLLQWHKMPELNLERPNALLNLQFLLSIEFIFADFINDAFGLYIPINVNSSWPRWHLDGIDIPLCLLILPQQRMVLWIIVKHLLRIGIFRIGLIYYWPYQPLCFFIVYLNLLFVQIGKFHMILCFRRYHRSL